MVFPLIADSHSSPLPLVHSVLDSPMASSTIKPQNPLHNFPLEDLKWSINQSSSHRFRKPADCSQKLLHLVSSPDSDGSSLVNASKAGSSGSSSTRTFEKSEKNVAKAGSSWSSPSRRVDKSEKKPGVSDSPAGNCEKKPKICIRIKTKQAKFVEDASNAGDQHQDQHQHQLSQMGLDDADETVAKTWNLRPRRSLIKASRRNGGVKKISVAVTEETKAQEPSRPESSRPKATNDAKMDEKEDKEKQKKPDKIKFSIPLSKLEIEEDIYALTGSKPSRKPKKRAKHVQKQLDYLFPGMWLSSITPDMYKVNEHPAKD